MNEKNPRTLFSLVALIYFPFIVNFLLSDNTNNEYNLSDNDLKIINTYKKAWYFVIILTIIAVLFLILSFFYEIDILGISLIKFIAEFLFTILIVYILINIIRIYSNEYALLFTKSDIKNLSINKVSSWNIFYILIYLPFINFYIYNSKKYTKEQEYWVKEASLFYFKWWIIWILSIFFPWLIILFYFMLFFIIIRSISLFFGIDFIPDSIKKIIYSSYENNPLETFSYICAFIYFMINNLYIIIKWKKTEDYKRYLFKVENNLKQTYDINSVLKKQKKYLYLLLSYGIFFILFIYLLYFSWYSFYSFVYIFSLLIFASYIIIDYYNHKKLVVIPIITPVINFIVNKFK